MDGGASEDDGRRVALPSSRGIAAAYSLYDTGAPHPLEFSASGVAACHCERCQHWAHFVATGDGGGPIYLVPTRDLIETFANWILRERDVSGMNEPLRVLEVGAGDGKLALHLRAALRSSGVVLVASDSGARGLSPASGADVAPLDAESALHAVAPHIVYAAFMPLGMDWTAAFRACASVRTYVLLGEGDDGCCGRPWATWGYLCDGDDDAADVCVSSTSGSSSGSSSEDGGDDADEEDGDRIGIRPASSGGGGRAAACGSGGGSAAACGSGGDDTPARVACINAWRRVYQYEPQRTPFGAAGWGRAELADVSSSLICRTDACWSSTRHAKAVAFRRAVGQCGDGK